MLTRPQMEEALINLDRRLTGIEKILQPLRADVAVVKTDVANLSGEVSGLQRDMAMLAGEMRDTRRDVLDAVNRLTTRFEYLTQRLEQRGLI